jgi:YD repeat-containing protein
LKAAGLIIEDGLPATWKRFFTYDPFGNRIEIHQPGGLNVEDSV